MSSIKANKVNRLGKLVLLFFFRGIALKNLVPMRKIFLGIVVIIEFDPGIGLPILQWYSRLSAILIGSSLLTFQAFDIILL